MTYTSPGSRGTAAILALYVKVGSCLLAIGALVGRIVVARGLEDGTRLPDDLLNADRLVELATVAEALGLLVAVVFIVRWYLVVRGNRAVLGEQGPRPRIVTASLVVVGAAVVALVLVWTALGEADDVADRQRIDTLRALAIALSAAAAGATIAAVSVVTRRQEEQAVAVDAPRATVARRGGGEPEEGGLRVVSEADARTDRGER